MDEWTTFECMLILQVQHHHDHRRIVIGVVIAIIDDRIPSAPTVTAVLVITVHFVTARVLGMIAARPTVPPPSVGIVAGIE